METVSAWPIKDLVFFLSIHQNCCHDYYYYIDRRIYLNLSKSTQRVAGLKVLKPAANGRYLMCKALPNCLHLLNRSTFILLSVEMHAGSFCVSVIHRTLTWTIVSLSCVRQWSHHNWNMWKDFDLWVDEVYNRRVEPRHLFWELRYIKSVLLLL